MFTCSYCNSLQPLQPGTVLLDSWQTAVKFVNSVQESNDDIFIDEKKSPFEL